MARLTTLEFANVTLTFGPGRVMADLLNEIVLPAITDTNQKRTYAGTTYFFHDVELLNLGTKANPEPAVGGTFIKDTTIRREQIWNPEKSELEKNERKLRTSPSATFVLLLTNHKLLYLHETSQAPGIDAFRGTFLNFLTRKYMDFIQKQYIERRELASDESRGKITKKALKEEYLPPELSIIPLASGANLEKYIAQYKVLSSLTIELASVNAEADNDPLFRKIRKAKEAVKAEKAILIESSKEGLDKTEVAEQLKSVALEGNARVKMHGLTPTDAPFDVTNEEIRLRVPMTNMPPDLRGKADRALREFTKSIDDGTILVARVDPEQAAAIRNKFRS